MTITLPRHAELWLPGLYQSWRRDRTWRPQPGGTPMMWLLFTDHWEPWGGAASEATAKARTDNWCEHWPRIAAKHRDSFGRAPRYTFFYPQEEYHRHTLDALAEMTRAGIADVEVHLHHDHDTPAAFSSKLSEFVATLRRDHDLLRTNASGDAEWCFIHGNWALDNSRPDGKWCGLNNELTLLRQLGCVADFTLPSAPSACQTSLVNAIYWATDDPDRPKSHDRGEILRPNTTAPSDSLLMVQGPLTVRRHPRYHILPNLEVGELASYAMPSGARVSAWLRAAPRVGNHLFVKLFGHGATEDNANALLAGGGLDRCLTQVRAACDARGWRLGFISAWESNRLLREIASGVTAPTDEPAWL